MVSFSILHRTDEQIMYEYYPENRKDKQPGIITIDMRAEKIGIATPAEDDFECCERCADEFDVRWWWYGSHAIRRICEDYNNGLIKDSGIVAWY